MTGTQRRQQLIEIGRALFAERGYEATSIEEIAQRAHVSKPVVYEHFGGKEGLYAVVVDREMSRLLEMITSSLTQNRSRVRVERVALALLTYVEEHTDGFRILVRDSSGVGTDGTYSSLLNEAISQVGAYPRRRFLATRFRSRPSTAVRAGAGRNGVHHRDLVAGRADAVEGSCRRTSRQFVLEWVD